MRCKLVMFLIEQEEDYLEKSGKNEEALPDNLWHPDFKYEKVQIPKKELPIHPKQLDVDIRSEKGVDEIKNPHIRSFLQKKKDEMEGNSLSSMVKEMHQAGVDGGIITEKIFEEIRKREKRFNQEQAIKKEKAKIIDQQILRKVLDEAYWTFLNLKVGCMFKIMLHN